MGFPAFFIYLPTYFHLISLYSFCRMDDFTWGTRGMIEEEPSPDVIYFIFFFYFAAPSSFG